jgi:hypothetical protein
MVSGKEKGWGSQRDMVGLAFQDAQGNQNKDMWESQWFLIFNLILDIVRNMVLSIWKLISSISGLV